VWQHISDLAAVYAVGNKNFGFWPTFQETPISEPHVTLAWREILKLNCFKRGCKQESKKGVVIVLNCSVKR
jgi:hypothetical protein